MSRLSRRGILGGAAALVPGAAVGVGVSPTLASPDAALLVIGTEAAVLIPMYERNVAAFSALPNRHPDLQRVVDLNDGPANRLDTLFEQAKSIRAVTAEGRKVKATLLQHELRAANRMDGEVTFAKPGEEMAWSLVCDMVEEGSNGIG